MMRYLIFDFWYGKIPLWKSYWFIGELLNALIIILIYNFEIYFLKNNQPSNLIPFLDFTNFSFLSKIIIIFWIFFITVGIWRSAEKYKGNIIWIIITFIFLSYRVFNLRLIFF